MVQFSKMFILSYLSLLVLYFTLPECSSTRLFIGKHEISDESWADKLATIDCFSNAGNWTKSAYAKDPVRKLYCNSAYGRHGHYNGFSNQYDYHTGNICKVKKTYFSIERMCEVMDGRMIGVVGDSISGEFAISLMNSIYSMIFCC